MTKTVDQFKPGQRVAVTQQIAQRDETWTIRVIGRVVRAEQAKTGSWFARAKDDRLWLDRLIIVKDDGEVVVINLDPYTHVEAFDEGGPVPAMPAHAGDPLPATNEDPAKLT